MPRDSMASTDAGRLRAAAAADDTFGADVYRSLGTGAQNTVFSPASIAAALQMALCGARGKTAAQIATALHLGGPESAVDGLRLLAGELNAAGGGADVTLRAPNTMWVQAGLPLSPEFTGQLQDIAAVTVRPADFARAPQEIRAQINELIAEQTADKITDLLGPDAVSSATRLVLANAVYLKAPWTFPFTATADAPFYPGDDGAADRADDAAHVGPRLPARRRLPGRAAAVQVEPAGHGRGPARRPAVRARAAPDPRPRAAARRARPGGAWLCRCRSSASGRASG